MLSIPAIGLAAILGHVACRLAVRGTALVTPAWSGREDDLITMRDLLGEPVFFLYWRNTW